MATTTTHYGFTKPGVNDYVDISVLNANFDNLDTVIYNNQLSAQAALDDIAPKYDATATYSVGDYVTYNKTLYKCATAITTAEAFDDTKWTAVKVGGELKSHDARISDLEAGVELEGAATNSFDDGIDSYFKKVVSTIVPVQAGSGTPSPTNARAISGFTECEVTANGKNLFDKSSLQQGFLDPDTGQELPSSEVKRSGWMKVNSSSIYFWNGQSIRFFFYKRDKTYISKSDIISNSTITTPSACEYIRIQGANEVWNVNNLQLEQGSSATSYEPYKANTATISFGSAGTVYGGYVDLISGKLVVEWGYLAPTEITQINQSGNTYYWLITSSIDGITGGNTVISSHFESAFGATAGHTYITGSGHALMAVPTDQSLNTKALADAWLQANNPQFVYELATPQEYQLTPAQLRSLVGVNRLTSSTGEVTEVEYIKNKTIAWLLDLIRA
jgi:hypothetical protein